MKWRKKGLAFVMVLLLLVTRFGALPAQPAEAASVSGQTIVNTARQYIDKVPYVYGGTKIDGTNPGADCSGFICRIYEKYGINMWSVRTHLRDYGTNIGTDLNKAQMGDIIWFDGHVAIYSGTQNGKHRIVHETGGSFQNVVETNVDVVQAALRGIIRIPGVNGNGTSAGGAQVTFSTPTDPDYTAKQSISNTNAVLVSQINKPSGVKVTQMGIILYKGDGIIKRYSEAVSNVSNTTTRYHSWFDVNKELGLTLESGTTYGYRFFGVFNGVEIQGQRQNFTTTGTPSSSYSVRVYKNEDKTNSRQTWAHYGETLEEVFSGYFPSAQEKPGYVFDHWYVVENGQQVPVDEGTLFRWTHDIEIYPAYAKMIEEDDPGVVLPPPDKVEAYTVTFMDLTNMTSYGSYEVKNGEQMILPSRTPTREGYTFLGWFTSASGGTEITANTIADLDGDTTYYARFEKLDEQEPDTPDTPDTPVTPPAGEHGTMVLTIDSPTLTVNGDRQSIDGLGTTPIIRNGRTLLPVRAVIEGMGGSATWHNDTRTVELWLDGHSLTLTLDSKMVQDGRNDYYMLDVAPISLGGRTMLPIRFVVEYFGGQVFWDNSSQTVTIVK